MSLNLENKSTNYHNSRKSALLSMLLIKNKLLMVLGTGALTIEIGIQSFIAKNSESYKALIIIHAERFIELASMVFDLYPFIPFLNNTTRDEISTTLDKKLALIENPLRHSRSLISLFKVRKVFGQLKINDVKLMHDEYLRILELDSKPEKGERKVADDLVLLINEVLEESFTQKVDSMVIYRIALMEFALERSPYNFDI